MNFCDFIRSLQKDTTSTVSRMTFTTTTTLLIKIEADDEKKHFAVFYRERKDEKVKFFDRDTLQEI
jgi:hypothetical protein